MVLPMVFMQQQQKQVQDYWEQQLMGLSLLSAGTYGGGLLGAAAAGSPSGRNTVAGELRAAPKSSGGGSWQRSTGSWSIPAARQQQQQLEEQHPPQAQQQQERQLWSPALAQPRSPRLPAAPAPGNSFEEVLAALQAETALDRLAPGEGRQQQQRLALHPPSDYPALQRGGSSSSSAADSMLSGGRMRSGREAASHRQHQQRQQASAASSRHQQPLPTFDPLEAEHQLKQKLDQARRNASCS